MKSLGILFKAPLVLALLNTRIGAPAPIDPSKPFKGCTRRLIKPQPVKGITGMGMNPDDWAWRRSAFSYTISNRPNGPDDIATEARYKVGDVLYVKETLEWRGYEGQITHGIQHPSEPPDLHYCADGAIVPFVPDDFEPTRETIPSIHMHRWAARIWLRVTSVGAERVEAITEEDAVLEGLEFADGDGGGPGPGYKWRGRGYHGGRISDAGKLWHTPSKDGKCSCKAGGPSPAQCAFLDLFYNINKRAPAGSNPWVWRYGFERIEKPEAPCS